MIFSRIAIVAILSGFIAGPASAITNKNLATDIQSLVNVGKVGATVNDLGTVTLYGIVNDENDANRAALAASKIAGVTKVVNNLTVTN